MGMILNAHCEKCGFEKEIYFGAGMMDFNTVCNVPAMNIKNGYFTVMNIFRKDRLKTDYKFYNDPDMYHGAIENDLLQWGDVYLKQDCNLCPKCKNFSMEFIDHGFFD